MPTDSEILYDKANKTFGSMQVKEETVQLMDLLAKEKIKNFMEVGIADGMTFYLWSALSEDSALKVGIDFPNGGWGIRRSYTEMAAVKQRLLSISPNTYILFGNSHDKNVKDWAEKTIGDEKLDFLFIDGDHSYEGAKQDYDFYSKFVKKGGLIALHDIKNTKTHKDTGCFVWKLWNELSGDKIEFLSDSSEFAGIGVIRKI